MWATLHELDTTPVYLSEWVGLCGKALVELKTEGPSEGGGFTMSHATISLVLTMQKDFGSFYRFLK
jgi:hypothetical protein